MSAEVKGVKSGRLCVGMASMSTAPQDCRVRHRFDRSSSEKGIVCNVDVGCRCEGLQLT